MVQARGRSEVSRSKPVTELLRLRKLLRLPWVGMLAKCVAIRFSVTMATVVFVSWLTLWPIRFAPQ